jgi:pyruvate kinase
MRIICSVGPEIKNLDSLIALTNAGMNTIRFNFSHLDYDETTELIDGIRTTLPDIQIVADLQGQKLRVSRKFKGEINVKEKDRVLFCHENDYAKCPDLPNTLIVPVQFQGDFSLLKTSRVIYMKDATMEFEVIGIQNNLIGTTVRRGGVIRAEKGMNAPGMDRSKLGLPQKDKEDIIWALKQGVDVLCISFVTNVHEVLQCKEIIKENKKISRKQPKIWAKIETCEGLENIDAIIKHVDGIMLGRGDLSAELGVYKIPRAQEMLLAKLKKSPKELIVATYVLETMKANLMPSVTECSDIYRAVKEKVDGFMLTGEVGVGKHPVIVVDSLMKIIEEADKVSN